MFLLLIRRMWIGWVFCILPGKTAPLPFSVNYNANYIYKAEQPCCLGSDQEQSPA